MDQSLLSGAQVVSEPPRIRTWSSAVRESGTPHFRAVQEKGRGIDVHPAAVDVIVRTFSGQQEAVTAAGQRPLYGHRTGCLVVAGLGARHLESRLLQTNVSPQKQFVVEFIPRIEPTGL